MAKRRSIYANPGSYKLSDEAIEGRDARGFGFRTDPADRESYDAPKAKIIPKEGAWVIITRQLPPLEGELDKTVLVGRIFYALHHEDSDEQGFRPSGLYLLRLNSPENRDLYVFPYEYSVMDVATILKCWQDGEMDFHPRNVDLATMNNIVFYARARGISMADAMVMALGTLKGDVGWFEPKAGLAKAMEAMEERVHRWKPKRASKARMEVNVATV